MDAARLVAPLVRDSRLELPSREEATIVAATEVVTERAGAGERAPQVVRRRAAAVVKTAPTRRLRPGDLVCGECGEGNAPTRKFCSRCGSSLEEALRVKAPWWRRLIPRRGPKVVPVSDLPGVAGSGRRPATGAAKHRMRKVLRKLQIVVGALIFLGGILYASYPPFRDTINGKVTAARDAIGKKAEAHFSPERPVSVTANLDTRRHPAKYATDLNTATYWVAPFRGRFPTLNLKFDHRVTLERMILNAGASGAHFTDHGRPALMVLVFSNKQSMTLTPADTPKGQTLNLSHAIAVTSVEIQIQAIHRGQTTASDVAVSNIELFGIG